jgi:hypothetical protein
METREERRRRLADEAAQERAGVRPESVPRVTLAPGYVRAPAGMHPDHGDAVVFTPGQLLPDWAAKALVDQETEPDEHGVYELKRRGRRSREAEAED